MADEQTKTTKPKRQRTSAKTTTKTETPKPRQPDQWAASLLAGLDDALGTEGQAYDQRTIQAWLHALWNASDRLRAVMLEQEMPIMNRVLAYLEREGVTAVRPAPVYADDPAEHRFRYGVIWNDRWVEFDISPIRIRPLEFTEHALDLLQPRGSLLSFEQIGREDWMARYISPQMAQADLTFEQHTKRARHLSPALAVCHLLLAR